jgi:hypothetical protein
MPLRLKPAAIPAAFLAVAILGCGSDVKPPKTTVESAQPPAKPPAGWKTVRDNTHGFSISVPPGWKQEGNGGSVLYRSPDHLVALSISVDRTGEAFAVPVARFAQQTIEAIPGYDGKLKPSPAHPITATPLDGALVTASGTTKKGGFHQEVEVAVVRRDHLVNYTGVIAANATSTPPDEIAAGRVMVASIRDQPIG